MERQRKSNHSTERYWQVPLKPSALSQIKKLLHSVSQQQPGLLWRQWLGGGGGLWATFSNQSSVTLEQLLLWVNNSRSRTFLAFIMELSIFKLARRAGGNFTRWQWPILDSFYLGDSTLFLISKNYVLACLSFPPFRLASECGCGRTCVAMRHTHTISRDFWKCIKFVSLNKVETGHV